MMRQRTIWKFSAPIADEFSVEMPAYSKVLSVQVQGADPVMWAVVEPTEPKVTRSFLWRGTGHSLGDVGRFVGTVQIRHGGALVFHLFEAPEGA